MKTILLVAATEGEMTPVRNKIIENQSMDGFVHFAVTGIGTTITTYHLTKLLLSQKYDLVVNIGIAGAFAGSCEIGDTVVVQSETFADWGVHTPSGFQTMFEAGLVSSEQHPFTGGELICPCIDRFNFPVDFKKVKSLTLNATSGNKQQIQLIRGKFSADIENMEGAAVFYTCLAEGVPFLEIRTVSNYIEPRDKSRWNIPLALNKLSENVALFVQTLR